MENLIKQSMLDSLVIKVFGELVSEYQNTDKILSAELEAKTLSVVKVVGVQVNGVCTRIDKPLTLVLPGKGGDPDSCGFDDSDNIKMWNVKRGTLASKIDISSGNIEQLLPQELLGAIDAGIKIKNVKYKDGKLTGRIEIWVKVGVKVSFAENFSIDTGIGDWITVTGFDLDIADVKVQVKLVSLNKACARIKACIDLPWPIGEQCAKATQCVTF